MLIVARGIVMERDTRAHGAGGCAPFISPERKQTVNRASRMSNSTPSKERKTF